MRRLVALLLFAVVVACSGAQQRSAENAGNDTYVTASVKAKLAGVDVDSADAVGVAVANGTVTLTGKAHSAAEAQAYVTAAHSVDGVHNVDDRLVVDSREHGIREQSADVGLAAKVAGAIAGQAGINVFHVKVSARDGVVSIEGTVPSQSIARTIVDTARSVDGVKRVVPVLTVHA